jgi:hypothetical protein
MRLHRTAKPSAAPTLTFTWTTCWDGVPAAPSDGVVIQASRAGEALLGGNPT